MIAAKARFGEERLAAKAAAIAEARAELLRRRDPRRWRAPRLLWPLFTKGR